MIFFNLYHFTSFFHSVYVVPHTPQVPAAFAAQQYGTLSRAQLNKLRQASRPNFPRTSTNQLSTHNETETASNIQQQPLQAAGSLRDLPPPPPLPLKNSLGDPAAARNLSFKTHQVVTGMPPPPPISQYGTLPTDI